LADRDDEVGVLMHRAARAGDALLDSESVLVELSLLPGALWKPKRATPSCWQLLRAAGTTGDGAAGALLIFHWTWRRPAVR
jgi:hypothetical protein